MIFNYNNQKEVVALLGAGSMGMAIVEHPGRGAGRLFCPSHAKQ